MPTGAHARLNVVKVEKKVNQAHYHDENSITNCFVISLAYNQIIVVQWKLYIRLFKGIKKYFDLMYPEISDVHFSTKSWKVLMHSVCLCTV